MRYYRFGVFVFDGLERNVDAFIRSLYLAV